MSRAQEPNRQFFPFGNPFRMILPKGSFLSPKLLALLNNFEETLAERLKKLKPAGSEDVLRFSWMILAVETLCGIHGDVKILVTALELPVSDWDDKWIDVYLVNSVKLMDICIAFNSEISRLQQSQLYLQCVRRYLNGDASDQFVRARSSLDGWNKHISSKNPRLENCFTVIDSLVQTLDLPKVKNSLKGKVLMQAMYGVRVVTLSICSILAAAFSGSSKNLIDFPVPETCMWAQTFTEIQTFVNSEVRTIYSKGRISVLKELEAVEMSVKVLRPFLQEEANPVEVEVLTKSISDLENSAEKFSLGLDMLSREVDSFFQIVLTGRDALISNLRIDGSIPKQVRSSNNPRDGQMVR